MAQSFCSYYRRRPLGTGCSG